MSGRPLVSVGVPVRNGGAAFPLALATVLGQTYTNLEIIISDNASEDGTSDVCAQAAADDERVRHVRHAEPLSAIDNFHYVFEQATGEFFLWAAHDDLRSEDYVEVLLQALLDAPDAGLAFGDIALIHDREDLTRAQPLTRLRGTEHESLRHRLLFPWRSCLPFYGLFRTEHLSTYQGWGRAHVDDVPILAAVATSSEIIRVPGTTFYFWGADHEAVRAERRGREKLPMPRWRFVRLHWVVADAVARSTGRTRRPPVFAYVHLMFWWWRLRGLVAARLPQGLVQAARRRADLIRTRRSRARP